MTGKPRRTLKQTQQLAGSVLGNRGRRVKEFDAVLEAVAAGATNIVLELRWYPDGGFHQLLLEEIRGPRAYFINPAGQKSEGPLARKAEPDGRESCTVAELRALFEEGKGEALIRMPAKG